MRSIPARIFGNNSSQSFKRSPAFFYKDVSSTAKRLNGDKLTFALCDFDWGSSLPAGTLPMPAAAFW